MASLPDAAVKSQVWSELVDPKSTFSVYQRRAKMQGFFQSNQLDICEPFFDKFYDSLATMHHEHQFTYITSFFNHLLPRIKIEDKHIVKLMMIKGQVPDTDAAYMNVLQDGIELLIRSKRVREISA